ncbi:MAG: RcpC/CpaB family pilus assembly protein [Solirubrobacteraceae bacterium MAG38_C4-C5]|nr:RcpC/CpaB family pilus assembly protein [Candidatus Siliceabacter maunaloa]
MNRRRRALVLAGIALLLGGLAAADVAGREAALAQRLGPEIPVVVARADVRSGAVFDPARLGVRRVPARFAPVAAAAAPQELAGLRAAVDVPAGADVAVGMVDSGEEEAATGAPVRPGERVAELVAAGSPELVQPGGRVDVLVTRTGDDGASGGTELALEDVEVLAVGPADPAAGGEDVASATGAVRVAASLRVTLRQAVYLAAAQAFASELRLLPRPADDRERGDAGLTVEETLR